MWAGCEYGTETPEDPEGHGDAGSLKRWVRPRRVKPLKGNEETETKTTGIRSQVFNQSTEGSGSFSVWKAAALAERLGATRRVLIVNTDVWVLSAVPAAVL